MMSDQTISHMTKLRRYGCRRIDTPRRCRWCRAGHRRGARRSRTLGRRREGRSDTGRWPAATVAPSRPCWRWPARRRPARTRSSAPSRCVRSAPSVRHRRRPATAAPPGQRRWWPAGNRPGRTRSSAPSRCVRSALRVRCRRRRATAAPSGHGWRWPAHQGGSRRPAQVRPAPRTAPRPGGRATAVAARPAGGRRPRERSPRSR
jgi:hypothetical protein